MVKYPVTIGSNATISEVAKVMAENNIGLF